MAKKKSELNKTIEILYKKMQMLDIADSYGIVLLKTGMALKVSHYFQYMLNVWSDYKMAQVTNNKQNLEKIMKETGGIIQNGELNIDLDAIMGMVAIYQIDNQNKQNGIGPTDDFLNLLDFEGGDSSPAQ